MIRMNDAMEFVLALLLKGLADTRAAALLDRIDAATLRETRPTR